MKMAFSSGTLVCWLAVFSLACPSHSMDIIGHRGASFDAPENTLAAFRLCFDQQADAAELDIHLTKDRQVIVMHDGDAKRTAGADLKLRTSDFSALHALDAGQFGKWKGSAFNEKPPALSEVLALIPAGKRLFIEIKVHSEIFPALADVLRNTTLSPKQLPIITFYYDVAKEAKRLFPGHEVSWLHGWGKDPETGEYPDIDELIKKAKSANLDGLDLHFDFPINTKFVKKVHDAGLRLYTWTVDDPVVARFEAKAGVDGITTNRPGWMRAQLGQ